MHTFNTHTSIKDLKKYFFEINSLELYYGEGQEFTGNWHGQAAERLGLRGRVDSESFARLCENRHPETGEPLTPITRTGRRIAQDHAFGVPKSVSLAYAHTGDERLLQAVRAAGDKVVQKMETMMATRVRANGQDVDRPTGNLVASEHVHLTARPVNGFPDPHVHVHLVVFNVTYDPVEKRFKAAQMSKVVDNTVLLDKVFLDALADELRKLGVKLTPTEKAYEIEGFERPLIERFSRRTKEIEETAARLKITDPVEKAKLGAMTREDKVKYLPIEELRHYWFDGLTEQEKAPLRAVAAVLQRSRAGELSQQLARTPDLMEREAITAEKTSDLLGTGKAAKNAGDPLRQSINALTQPKPPAAVGPVVKVTEHDRRAAEFAVRHVFERQSVVTLDRLQAETLNGWNCGLATLAGASKALEEMPLLRKEIKGRIYVTTREVLAEENRLIGRCLREKCKHEALNSFWKIEDERLNTQQREAVLRILNSRDGMVGIAGKAGTGKTTLMHEVRRGIEAGMHKFLPLAPSSEASRETLREEGFKNAETVAKLLVSEKLQQEARGAVWLIDEAGLLSTRQADRLFKLAEKLNARLVLVGDTGQHHSVERGQAFDLLKKFGNLGVTEVTEIQRQSGQYKQVVELVAAGKVDAAFAMMDEMGWLQEMTLEQRQEVLAKDYIDAVEQGKTALVVAPTRAECAEVTAGIRKELRKREKLKGGVEWDILRDLSWTEAQKSDWGQYQAGQVVRINGHVKGFALGERVEVIGADGKVVRVRSRGAFKDKIKLLPVNESEKFNVYERDKIEISEGERIRVRINTRTADGHRVSNGNLYSVDYIDPKGRLVLTNGWRLNRDFAHLEHGYTMTSHSSQSKTVDCVFVAQTAKFSALASDLAQFYVAISRGRSQGRLYCDSIEAVRELVSEVRERPMAMEILNEDKSEKAMTVEEPMRLADALGQTAEYSTPELETKVLAMRYQQPEPEREEPELDLERD
jgi:conjugative relaxase-like TrwC/TraI family protein